MRHPPLSPATTTRGVWWPWLGWVTGGECLGFAVPGVVAVVLAAAPRPVFAVGLLAAGAVEGAILGGAQAVVLRRIVPEFPVRPWVVRTSVAAVFAWLIGLLPSTYSDDLATLPMAVLVPVMIVAGIALVLAIGVAQRTVLRTTAVRAAWRWIPVTAPGWAIGLGAFAAVTSPLWQPGQGPVLVGAIGVLGGLVMAAAMAAVTGAGLVWLLRRD